MFKANFAKPISYLNAHHLGLGIMEQVLLLNITYEPLRIINWKKAITLLCLGKVEVIEEYRREIHSVSFTVKLPSVVRLLRLVKRPKTPVKFSRQNIYARDRYKCQYCGARFATEDLTSDNVIPRETIPHVLRERAWDHPSVKLSTSFFPPSPKLRDAGLY